MAGKQIPGGFLGKRRESGSDAQGRVPPGQHAAASFPVLSSGTTPHTPLVDWSFTIEGLVKEPVQWTWGQFLKLPAHTYTVDISCVTRWTMLDTKWKGVSIDTLFEHVETDPQAGFVLAFCDGAYTTNFALADLIHDQAFIAYEYNDKPLAPEHGGPARLVVPHLYFWKSAKWIRGLRLMAEDKPGYWESRGYHNHGDPWKEERYWGD